jgi:hypothetical protein
MATTQRPANHGIIWAAVVLIVCCLVMAVCTHYAVFSSDTVFILAIIPGFIAVWFAVRSWRTIFRGIADSLQWDSRTCRVIALVILAGGFALWFLLGHRYGILALCISILAANGCLPLPPSRTVKTG